MLRPGWPGIRTGEGVTTGEDRLRLRETIIAIIEEEIIATTATSVGIIRTVTAVVLRDAITMIVVVHHHLLVADTATIRELPFIPTTKNARGSKRDAANAGTGRANST